MDASDADSRMLERTYLRFPLVNRVVGGWAGVYRSEIRPRARSGPVRVLDVGAGGGDVSRAIAAWAGRDGIALEMTALDADERAVRWAERRGGRVAYRWAHTSDLRRDGSRFDVVISNHLLHHLGAAELGALLEDCEQLVTAGGVVLHRDIERSTLAYRAFAAATMPFAGNLLADSFIREDGLTSIRRSYTAPELAEVAPPGWRVRRSWPARLTLRFDAQEQERR